MSYTIKNCSKEELPLLQKFINKYWAEDHVFVKSKSLMDFQHLNTQAPIYNFFIAINDETQTIDGIIGYIPTSQYDATLYNNGDYWGAIWKVRTDVENEEIKMLGLLLWENTVYREDLKTFGAIGLSNTARRFYKINRKVFTSGTLNQYYILREQNTPYIIAQVPINTQQTKRV